MKIAVASEKGMVTGHFGHCENFMVFNAENDKIVGTETVPNPGTQARIPSYFPQRHGGQCNYIRGHGRGSYRYF